MSSTCTITNSTVSYNSVHSGGVVEAGGLRAHSSTLTITNSTVNYNSALGEVSTGGGIGARDSKLTIINSTVNHNSAQQSGGGVSIENSVLQKTDGNMFANNTCNGRGAAILGHSGSRINISQNLFTNNKASGSGGAISLEKESRIISNSCTFTDNWAMSEGAACITVLTVVHHHNSSTF